MVFLCQLEGPQSQVDVQKEEGLEKGPSWGASVSGLRVGSFFLSLLGFSRLVGGGWQSLLVRQCVALRQCAGACLSAMRMVVPARSFCPHAAQPYFV